MKIHVLPDGVLDDPDLHDFDIEMITIKGSSMEILFSAPEHKNTSRIKIILRMATSIFISTKIEQNSVSDILVIQDDIYNSKLFYDVSKEYSLNTFSSEGMKKSIILVSCSTDAVLAVAFDQMELEQLL